MTALTQAQPVAPSKEDGQYALEAVLNILEKWDCKPAEKAALLGVSRSTLYKYIEDPLSVRVTKDLMERLGYLIGIHGALRQVFTNPKNVYGFVHKQNYNGCFAGRTPLSYMANGRVADLYEAHEHIDGLRGGEW